MTKEWT
ncbi:conserved hypothetical protein, partial [Trichinella spiralis]